MPVKFPDFAAESGSSIDVGLNTITLASSAVSGHRTFANAASDSNIDFDDGDDVYVDVTDESGGIATWRATYASGAGTLELVSTEAAQGTLTSGDSITVYASVSGSWFDEMERERWNPTAGTDANTTMTVNTTYTVDMSAWATASRTYTLPATFAVGDIVDIYITGGNDSYELILKPNTGDDVEGGTAAAEHTRLFIEGERIRYRGSVTNTTWVVEVDGRIPCYAWVYQSSTSTAHASGDWGDVENWTVDTGQEIGACADKTNDKWVARRAMKLTAVGIFAWSSAAFNADSEDVRVRLYDGTSVTWATGPKFRCISQTDVQASIGASIILAQGEGAYIQTRQTSGSSIAVGDGKGNNNLFFQEVL